MKVSLEDYSNLLQPVASSQTVNLKGCCESFSQYLNEYAEGYLQDIELRTGLVLTISEYQWREPVTVELPEREHCLQLSFFLAGNLNCSLENCSVRVGETALSGCGMAAQASVQYSQAMKTIDIHIEADSLKAFLDIQDNAITPELKRLFRKFDQENYVGVGKITTQMQVVLQQIIQCPFEGLFKRIYLESKVMELIALRLQQDKIEEISSNHQKTLKRHIIERIYHAKNILERHLDNPPSLSELAAKVGISEYQLKVGFQKVFGVSTFQYLHQYRMEQARLLLYERGMSIAEVANAVGYSHLGRFSVNFKRKFGISPSDCLKGVV
ncbi:MAG TPA: helix-turn-helix transcriptional regulator [Trichormus sp. M33_DOE_039]|nr:helix-turn-helix transcriptional regulator [Trichormus sp. M33_DOE_039]